MLEPVLPWTDVFFPNDDEARAITGIREPAEQARALRATGVETVAVTCGPRGTVVAGPSGVFRATGFAVELVDGTGSGDAFAAGYIHALLNGGDLGECVRVGSALGASCVRATGATTGVFRADELAAFLSSHSFGLQPV